MDQAAQTYTEQSNRLMNLFINPAGELRETTFKDTKQGTYRFPSKYKTQLAYDLINTIEKDNTLFQIKQFCVEKGITLDELEGMAQDNVTLSRALKFAKDCFETRLVSMGFTSQKATMAIFALKNQHDYRDRQASDEHRASIVVNLHLPSRDGAVMAKYEVIESQPVKKRSKKIKRAIGIPGITALEKVNESEKVCNEICEKTNEVSEKHGKTLLENPIDTPPSGEGDVVIQQQDCISS